MFTHGLRHLRFLPLPVTWRYPDIRNIFFSSATRWFIISYRTATTHCCTNPFKWKQCPMYSTSPIGHPRMVFFFFVFLFTTHVIHENRSYSSCSPNCVTVVSLVFVYVSTITYYVCNYNSIYTYIILIKGYYIHIW